MQERIPMGEYSNLKKQYFLSVSWRDLVTLPFSLYFFYHVFFILWWNNINIINQLEPFKRITIQLIQLNPPKMQTNSNEKKC